MQTADVVKVQQNKTNTFICITRPIQKKFPVKKGDRLLMVVDGDKIIVKRAEED